MNREGAIKAADRLIDNAKTGLAVSVAPLALVAVQTQWLSQLDITWIKAVVTICVFCLLIASGIALSSLIQARTLVAKFEFEAASEDGERSAILDIIEGGGERPITEEGYVLYVKKTMLPLVICLVVGYLCGLLAMVAAIWGSPP